MENVGLLIQAVLLIWSMWSLIDLIKMMREDKKKEIEQAQTFDPENAYGGSHFRGDAEIGGQFFGQ